MIDPRHVIVAVACWLTGLSAVAGGSDGPVPAPRMQAVAHCSWDRPGHNPFIGEVVPAVDRYADIPAPVRGRLKERIAARRYDEIVEIRRDSISGRHSYRPEIRDMHFGVDRVCREVTRSGWSDAMRERGLVYCDSGHCILVPTVCRNVSRIERVMPAHVAGESIAPPAEAAPAGGPAAEAPPAAAGDPAVGGPTFADGVAATPVAFGPWAPMGGADGGGGDPGDGAGIGGGPGWIGPSPMGLGGGGDFPGGGTPGHGPAAWAPGAPPAFDAPVFAGGGGGGEGGPFVDGGSVVGDSKTPPAISPVPEASTWAGLLGGLVLLAVNAARQRRAGVPRCATQKRS